ncbi:O-antigen ligase family protein [Pelagibacterium sp.]|uniref:O-antigen ligase family protein n=1 Tax=Pelagibacterium sp. TaxID=1967288 RepID=UPI003A939CAB
MTLALPGQTALAQSDRGRAWFGASANKALGLIVGIWIFSGGFVIVEPSPYEVMFLLAFAVALAGGLQLRRETLPLLVVIIMFTPFALISPFFMRYQDITDGLIFNLVTIFLMVTSYFAANFVAQAPLAHMRLIAKAYIGIALITSVVGTLAYMGLLPGEDVFLRFGRAKAFFKDPNVYGPFLILPAMFVLQRVLLSTNRRTAILNGLAYLIIFVGVFVSFSRGAWGHLAASSLLIYALVFILEASAREKVRLLLLAVGGLMVLAFAMSVLLSIPVVADLFTQRFSLTQSYDTGELGRFGRIWYTLDLALTNPWGIGPLEYGYLRITEQPHNTYLNIALTYGWGGAIAYYLLVGSTLVAGSKALAGATYRPLLIPVFATFVPMIALSGIIDTDHWRHWFLVTGLVWGICAASSTGKAVPGRQLP